jgi:class 3 adenylate cyclase
MTSSPRLETEFDSRRDQKLLVREWRAEQLRRLGVPPAHAALFADLVDWHAIADLVARGCPPTLALKIVR